jgi:hypothetical protein
MNLQPLLGLAAVLLPDEEKAKLVLRSGRTFAIGDDGMTMTFTLDADGRATAVVVRARSMHVDTHSEPAPRRR